MPRGGVSFQYQGLAEPILPPSVPALSWLCHFPDTTSALKPVVEYPSYFAPVAPVHSTQVGWYGQYPDRTQGRTPVVEYMAFVAPVLPIPKPPPASGTGNEIVIATRAPGVYPSLVVDAARPISS